MRISYILVIFIVVAVFYGLLPIAGAFYSRYKWVLFRRRFNQLRISPLLNYRLYRQLQNDSVFRFTGEIESITDGSILWVKGEDLTIPVSLTKTKCYLLPAHEGEGVPEPPEQVRWNRVSTLSEGAKVFIGGLVTSHENRMSFVSTKENPLMVIFYNCDDTQLTSEITRASRTKGEYWNNFTPISLGIGALFLIYFAASFLNRPAFRLTVITALIAIFIPILPVFPPGVLFTSLYRRLTWHARKFRAYWDLARLPMRYLPNGDESAVLSTGEKYGYVRINSVNELEENKEIPFLLPVTAEEKKTDTQEWHFFGVLNEDDELPVRSIDPFVSYGLLPSHPNQLAKAYAVKAYIMEFLAWILLITGISVNIVFIYLILYLLNGF